MTRIRALLLAAAIFVPAAFAADAAPLELRVYHTNDVHGWIMARPDKREPGRLVGGAAALKALVDKDSGPKLLVDAGDWWQGTPEGTLTKGEAVAAVFNALGYDAVALGNHEFDAGQEALRALIGTLRAPVLAANVYGADGKPVPWTGKRLVKEVAGVKVGIFGLLTTHMDKLSFPKNVAGLTFRREADEARDQVAALKREGADVIIALTHVGYEANAGASEDEGDRFLAANVPGLDLIVGGHSHTFLTRPYRDPAHGTLVVQAGSYLLKAGRATLRLDPETKRVVGSDDELLELRPERGEDPVVKAVVDAQVAAAGKAFELVVATASAPLERGGLSAESGLGSWMADCYKDWSGVDVGLQNGGGIRADIPAGPVTLRHLFNVMPFDNSVVKLQMKGSALRIVLDHGVGGARPVQIGGMDVEYFRVRPRGRRLAFARVGGAPLDDAKIYSLATLDFLVTGGDGYDQFGAAEAQEATGALARDVLRACAEKQKTIAPPAPGRLKARED